MTGAGAASAVAWAPEQSYLGGTGTSPTYREPGANIQVNTAELNRNLLTIYAPDDPEAQDFLAQNLEGQLDVSFVLENDQFHRLLFNDGFTGFTSGLANSAEWYLGVDYVGSGGQATTERQIKGWAPATASIEYRGSTEAVRVTLSGAYGDEETNTAITPGTVSRTEDEVPGHGSSLSLAGSGVTRLQSATLQFEGISRLRRAASQTPIDAVAGNVQTSVNLTAFYDGPELYERALGTAGATTTQTSVDAVAGTLSFDVAGSEVASYDLATIKPDSYAWEDLVNPDADLSETVALNATGVTGSDPTV